MKCCKEPFGVLPCDDALAPFIFRGRSRQNQDYRGAASSSVGTLASHTSTTSALSCCSEPRDCTLRSRARMHICHTRELYTASTTRPAWRSPKTAQVRKENEMPRVRPAAAAYNPAPSDAQSQFHHIFPRIWMGYDARPAAKALVAVFAIS